VLYLIIKIVHNVQKKEKKKENETVNK